ncbi:hypothetical protein JTE90_016950 [Oedothorax gibbosus]|uniref:Uncharacterized protein n=1 Tax=Oedothorax gibbosus TaxID=931172 RepID=A0AAV6TMS6_9ARAC|nr:hypothetical protein JTE90_016950 [Oedothorax gibbosus]
MSVQDIFPDKVVDQFEFLNYNKDYWKNHLANVTAHISFQESDHKIHHLTLKQDWHARWIDHFHRVLNGSHEENEFEPKGTIDWGNIENRLKKDPRRGLTHADMRLLFRLDNMYLVKYGFTFGHLKVKSGTQHVIQTSFAPILYYELPKKDALASRAFVSYYRLQYQRYILPPHGIFRVPEGTRYLLMSVQKTIFSVDVLPKKTFVPGSRACKLVRKYARQHDVPPAKAAAKDEKRDSSKRKKDRGDFKIPKKPRVCQEVNKEGPPADCQPCKKLF